MNTIGYISDLEKFLTDLEPGLASAIVHANCQENPTAILMTGALGFGQKTLSAMRSLLESGADPVFACVLSRPFYETAVRMLWAARESHGWDRLLTYYANQDKKWGREAIEIPGMREVVHRALKTPTEVLAWTDSSGRKFEDAPPLKTMLTDIEARDRESNLSGDEDAQIRYAYLYRPLCWAAHGHIKALVPSPQGQFFFLSLACNAAMGACWSLYEAYCHMAQEAPRPAIVASRARILEIMFRNRE
jgi:hypothetical protein